MRATPINVAVLFFAALLRQGLCTDLLGWLIISTPNDGKIKYINVPPSGDFKGLKPQTLIDKGLLHPQGVAVDHKRKRLFIADPDNLKIYVYTLTVNGDSLSASERPTVVADGIESRWVAVDGIGNVFFSDEQHSKIFKVKMARMVRGDTKPAELYSGTNLTQVNHPGGVAVDNFHVYWSNKRYGMKAGTIVKGSEVADESKAPIESIYVLAKNSPKSYGVCLALNNVFYTDAEKSIFGVKKTGGRIMEVNRSLKKPRGCVWDGDGTIYVADREQNAVYGFSGNMHRITNADVTKAFDIDDAFGLAFLDGASRPAWSFVALLATLIIALRN